MSISVPITKLYLYKILKSYENTSFGTTVILKDEPSLKTSLIKNSFRRN